MTDRFLLADVGGTRSRVGLGDAQGLDNASVEVFSNADFTGFAAVLQTYLDTRPGPVAAICAGVAGPVQSGAAQLTNFDWCIDAAELCAATGAPSAYLLNDLQAQGYALNDLHPGSLKTLFSGSPPPPQATCLVMGLGTGCNIAVVHQTERGPFVPPSETGHSSLPFMDGDAGALIAHLAETHYHRPIEAALSGPGLSRIFRYISGDTLTAAEIIRCYARGDVEATATLSLFVEILSTVAGNIAMAHLPMGGFYFIGGTARAVAPFLDELGFLDHFTAKGPYTPIIRKIPVFLIDNDTAALNGCRCYLLQGMS